MFHNEDTREYLSIVVDVYHWAVNKDWEIDFTTDHILQMANTVYNARKNEQTISLESSNYTEHRELC